MISPFRRYRFKISIWSMIFFLLWLVIACTAADASRAVRGSLPSFDEAMAAKQDVWVLALDHPVPNLTPEVYRLEAFASTDPILASNGVVFVKFDLAQGTNGFLAVEFGGKGPARFVDGKVMDEEGQVLGVFGPGWKWE